MALEVATLDPLVDRVFRCAKKVSRFFDRDPW
jgi:hypothetical protein